MTSDIQPDRLRWREPDEYGTSLLFFMSLYAGYVEILPDGGAWRAWVSTSYDGRELGRYTTAQEAKQALEMEVQRAVNE